MDYCGVVKNVAQPTKTTIAEQKKLIEESKDFLTAIKRKKGDFSCKGYTHSYSAEKRTDACI